ncbi:endonuclease/exonuclease/phosphatase family protein [Mesorhizobium atlanticum]
MASITTTRPWPTPAIWANAVISRYPIVKPTADDPGVAIDVKGRSVYVFCVNLDDAPYQPYQLLNIEYGAAPFLKTADEAIKSAESTRGKAFNALIADADAATNADAVFIAGDFNEPSHRDWTLWHGQGRLPATGRRVAQAPPSWRKRALSTLFRAAYPDEVAKPGITWTPTTEASNPEDHHDRIDFIFARAKALKVHSAGVVGEKTLKPTSSFHHGRRTTVRW